MWRLNIDKIMIRQMHYLGEQYRGDHTQGNCTVCGMSESIKHIGMSESIKHIGYTKRVQWNLCIMDTLGPAKSVQIIKVS